VNTFRTILDLDAGDIAVVSEIDPSTPSAKRLADMGFVPGAVVEMLQPGLPCIILFGSTRLGLGEGYQRAIGLEGNQLD